MWVQAKNVLAKSQKEARNAHKIDYDEAVGFQLCAKSLTPIYRGTPSVRSPYSGAAYHERFKHEVCVIDGIAEIGTETLGLVCTLARQ